MRSLVIQIFAHQSLFSLFFLPHVAYSTVTTFCDDVTNATIAASTGVAQGVDTWGSHKSVAQSEDLYPKVRFADEAATGGSGGWDVKKEKGGGLMLKDGPKKGEVACGVGQKKIGRRRGLTNADDAPKVKARRKSPRADSDLSFSVIMPKEFDDMGLRTYQRENNSRRLPRGHPRGTNAMDTGDETGA